MAQLTVEERRRIFLNRQQTERELLRRLSASAGPSEPRPARPRRSRMLEITLIAALLSAGWFVSQAVVLHVPGSLAEILPRL